VFEADILGTPMYVMQGYNDWTPLFIRRLPV
jgi:hypothetical protein